MKVAGRTKSLVVASFLLMATLLPVHTAAGAELVRDGFEVDLTQWTTTERFSRQQAIVHSGSWAARATSSVGSAYATKVLAATQSDLYVRAWVNIVQHSGSTPLLRVRAAAGKVLASLNVTASDTLLLKNSVTGASKASSTQVPPGTWVELQLHVVVAGSTGRSDVWVNGQAIASLSGTQNFGTAPIGRVTLAQHDSSTSFSDLVFDDVVVATEFVQDATVPPETPTGFSGAPAARQVDLTWDPATGATGYRVYREDIGATPLATVTAPSYRDATVQPSSTYVYTLEAFNGAGTSLATPPLSITTPAEQVPDTPTGLSGTATSERVELSWSASDGATTYDVYRDGSSTPLASVETPSYVDADVNPATLYSYTVEASNGAGTSSPTAPFTITTDPVATNMIVMAAGDIACDPADSSFNGGNGTSSKCRQKATSNLLSGADHVLSLGDQQYECGGLTAFQRSYDLSWGRFKEITHPILADEEYATSGTGCGAAGPDGYLSYFADQLAPHQASAQDPKKGYYSFDIGAWHVVALNSECSKLPDGCGEGSAQNTWLEQDLAASDAMCTLAMLHKPRFKSKMNGEQVTSEMLPFWEDLYADGAEIVLGGDSHFYERFAPQTPGGSRNANGVVQFVVGTGGKSHGGLALPESRLSTSETGTRGTFGVLELTLRDGAYDWNYLVEGSSSFRDTGTASCH